MRGRKTGDLEDSLLHLQSPPLYQYSSGVRRRRLRFRHHSPHIHRMQSDDRWHNSWFQTIRLNTDSEYFLFHSHIRPADSKVLCAVQSRWKAGHMSRFRTQVSSSSAARSRRYCSRQLSSARYSNLHRRLNHLHGNSAFRQPHEPEADLQQVFRL